MDKSKNSSYSSQRWNEPLIAHTTGHIVTTEDQDKKEEKFKKDFVEWINDRKK